MVDPNLIYPGKDPDFVFPEEGSEMTYQEILEGITRHRADNLGFAAPQDMVRVAQKIEQIEWALQALAEKLRDTQEGP